MLNDIWHGDCLEEMRRIPDGSVNLVCTDLPYGVTRNKWDSVIPMDSLWAEYRRITVKNAAVLLFGQGLFSAKLILSNEAMYRYSWVWQKTSPTGHLNANRMPLRGHEDVLVFYRSLPTYNPQKTKGHTRKVSTARHKRASKKTTNYGPHGLTSYDSTERYPTTVLTFAKDSQKSALTPTQKPLALIEYLVRTYSNEGDLVVDSTCGSNTTGLACLNTNRRYIGIEKNWDTYVIGRNRVASAQ